MKLPTPDERARNPPSLQQVQEFHELVRGASIKVYLFERATRAAIEQLAIQDAHEAELVAAREFALANMDADSGLRAKRRLKASIKAVMMGVRMSRGMRSSPSGEAKSVYSLREVGDDGRTVRSEARTSRSVARSVGGSSRAFASPGSVRSSDRDRDRDRDTRDRVYRDRDRDRDYRDRDRDRDYRDRDRDRNRRGYRDRDRGRDRDRDRGRDRDRDRDRDRRRTSGSTSASYREGSSRSVRFDSGGGRDRVGRLRESSRKDSGGSYSSMGRIREERSDRRR